MSDSLLGVREREGLAALAPRGFCAASLECFWSVGAVEGPVLRGRRLVNDGYEAS